MGEEVFIGPESSERPAKVAYVRYYCIAVQRMFRKSKYCPEGIPKSSIRLVLLSVRLCTIHRVRRTICLRMSSGPLVYIHQKVAYVRNKRQEHTSANPSVHSH
jgi:hypothetical protein